MQATLEQAVLLDLLPRSDIEVFVQVLQADGGERAACINAAVLAMANAGRLHLSKRKPGSKGCLDVRSCPRPEPLS